MNSCHYPTIFPRSVDTLTDLHVFQVAILQTILPLHKIGLQISGLLSLFPYCLLPNSYYLYYIFYISSPLYRLKTDKECNSQIKQNFSLTNSRQFQDMVVGEHLCTIKQVALLDIQALLCFPISLLLSILSTIFDHI